MTKAEAIEKFGPEVELLLCCGNCVYSIECVRHPDESYILKCMERDVEVIMDEGPCERWGSFK